MFEGTRMVISTEERYLGAVGYSSFVRQYVKKKVECWLSELEMIAETQPHAAYAAYAILKIELPSKGN